MGALYGTVDFKLGEATTLTLGGRQTFERIAGHGFGQHIYADSVRALNNRSGVGLAQGANTIDEDRFTDPCCENSVERLNRELMIGQLRDTLEGLNLRLNLMPLDQTNGAHLQYPQFATVVPADSVRHLEDWLARLNAMPAQIEQLIEVSSAGLKAGLMPPKYLLEKVAVQCNAIAKPAGIDSAFAAPLQAMPDSIPAADRARLKAAIIAAIDGKVRPAYRRLATFVASRYAPKGRREPGIWSLPDGDALYR